jgi:hypothetical protein
MVRSAVLFQNEKPPDIEAAKKTADEIAALFAWLRKLGERPACHLNVCQRQG